MESTKLEELENWLGELDYIKPSEEFSIKAPSFIKPYHLATLAQKLRARKTNEVHFPPKLTSYANAMDFWTALELEPPYEIVSRTISGRYHPITLLNDVGEIDAVTENLVSMFSKVCEDKSTLNAIDTMLRELIGNCYSHSNVADKMYGIICAQVWNGGRKAQIALCDSGIGIKNSLLENAEYIEKVSQSNSCEFATQYGVTSKPGRGHSGYGLALARALIEQNKGLLFVRSGDECFQSIDSKSITYNARHYQGTLLVIEWNLDVSMNIKNVYNSWPQIEGMTDDDFDL